MEGQSKHMVGGYIPLPIYRLINLYSIAKQPKKTDIIVSALTLWLEENEVDENILCAELRKVYEDEWRLTRSNPNTSAKDFIHNKQVSLRKKNVDEDLIDKIFEDFKYD